MIAGRDQIDRLYQSGDEPEDKIRHLIKMGEQTCFTLQSLVNPVPVTTTATLNGSPLSLEQ